MYGGGGQNILSGAWGGASKSIRKCMETASKYISKYMVEGRNILTRAWGMSKSKSIIKGIRAASKYISKCIWGRGGDVEIDQQVYGWGRASKYISNFTAVIKYGLYTSR